MNADPSANNARRKAKSFRLANPQIYDPTELLRLDLLDNQILDDSDEARLAKRIGQLWCSDRLKHQEAIHNREAMGMLRVELGKDLSRYKKILAHTGRAGKWTAFLREYDIPRATADRYVQRWEESQNPTSNRLSEAISPPTPDQIAVMARKAARKLATVLVTEESKTQFLEALRQVLHESIQNNPAYPECT